MKPLILIFIFTISYTLFAQDESKLNHTFGFQIYPNLAFSFVKPVNEIQQIPEGNHEPKFSFGANFFKEFRLKSNFFLGCGLGYYNFGYQTKIFTEGNGYIPTWSGGYVPPPERVKYITNFHNVELPVYAKYKINKRLHATAGTSVLYNVSATITKKNYDDDLNEIQSKTENHLSFYANRDFNASIFATFGADYFQGKKITLFIDLKCQYILFNLTKAPLTHKVLSAFISTGIRF